MSRTIRLGQDRFILPDPTLAGCLFGAVLRDTRGRGLVSSERFNHFPASPLCAISWFLDGRSHRVRDGVPDPGPLPLVLFAGPQDAPVTSWNPGPVLALTLGIYPDAWAALTGQEIAPLRNRFCRLQSVLADSPLRDVLLGLKTPEDLTVLAAQLVPLWRAARAPGPGPARHGLTDWTRALALRAMLSGAGQSARQVQRRIRAWTGQNRRALSLFSRVEALGTLSPHVGADLAGLAQEAGFSDQSHMGRALKRVTGLSPGALNRAIARDEPLWVYRLMGERF